MTTDPTLTPEERDGGDDLHTELAARMPWLHAQPDSMWEASGKNPTGGTFTNCLARVLPPFVTGSDTPVFEVLIYAQLGYYVPASAITTARELLLVDAADPTSAYYDRDQKSIDHALAEPGQNGEAP